MQRLTPNIVAGFKRTGSKEPVNAGVFVGNSAHIATRATERTRDADLRYVDRPDTGSGREAREKVSDYSKDKGDDEHKLAVESLKHLLGHIPKRRRRAASLQDGVEELLGRIGLLKKLGAVRNVRRALP